MPSLVRYDLRCLRDCALLGGVDEAGRGALAGPVVAGAVFVDRRMLKSAWAKRKMAEVNDSKQLSADLREQLFALLEEARSAGDVRAAAGTASVEEIATKNILGATRLAMARALEAACPEGLRLPGVAEEGGLFSVADPDAPNVRVILDGKPMRPFPFAHDALVQGDGKSFAIALASIVAKVTRDRIMEKLDGKFSEYGFREHKGYGTPAHRRALLEHGPCVIHRRLFLRKILGETPETEIQDELLA